MDFLLENSSTILTVSLGFSLALLVLLPRPASAQQQQQQQPPKHGTSAGAPPPPALKGPRVVVLVLGDIGRSPRMQYHALSIARRGGQVDLVGYDESAPRPEILANENIFIHAVPVPPSYLSTSLRLLFPIIAPLKICFQIYHLLTILLYAVPASASFILIQNPPSMPTFVVAWLVGRMRGMTVIIDWHNFGWTILQQKLGNAPVIHVAKAYERLFGKIAGDINFTVTHAMKDVLRSEYGITAPIHALHDRPPSHFHPITASARQTFLTTFPETSAHAESIISGKTKLIVSSTSWTPDEDFQLIIDALIHYDRVASQDSFLALTANSNPDSLPSILLIITGKGPLKEFYLQKIAALELYHITIKTAWLEAEDYPTLLACADLGVCLHTSSSGVDLPMKVVDLFGVGVPVAAFEFLAIGELVKDGLNGVIFKDGIDLGEALKRLFNPSTAGELKLLKQGALKEMEKRWDDNWDAIAAPVFGFKNE